MSPAEITLAGPPTFADLCDNIRVAARAHHRAIERVDAAQEAVKAAQAERDIARDADERARDALDSFIAREVDVA